ncbi:class I SAM-dependent methyltransferase [Leucothrix pacifica]|uniref:SAM-dependent methyltransferase n=1 Tax=Leucothrix pacifica TaxID=1247513 RepID=A0A317C921_9GAMM|nr:class I SAM-dependent methyltransferase [Leucothrix pacifica]PWQ92840.1 SAM-dependent methyltransferase [Leucothrix pacifica]
MWNERYSTEEYVYGTTPNEFLNDVSHRITGNKVLCLAEGEGRNAVYLAREGYDVMAVDASAVGLEKAEILADESYVNINTQVADLAEYEIEPESWDGIVSIFCHVPSDIRKALHQKVVTGLRPGGVFILEAYRPEQLAFKTGGPPVADLMMSLDDLKQELAGLEFVHAKALEREIKEGSLHTGMGAVVQIVAIKPGGEVI